MELKGSISEKSEKRSQTLGSRCSPCIVEEERRLHMCCWYPGHQVVMVTLRRNYCIKYFAILDKKMFRKDEALYPSFQGEIKNYVD